MKSQRFGIEVEMTGLTRKEAATVAAKHFRSQVEYRSGTYDEYHVLDNKARTWKLVSYNSISPMQKDALETIIPASNTYKVELVSPILTYEDIEALQELIRTLRIAGAISDSKYGSGIHIHVDAKKHTPSSLKNLVNLMTSKEDLLYKALNIDLTRIRYCKKVNDSLIAAINKKKPKTITALAYVWYQGQGYGSEDRTRHYHNSRYHSQFTQYFYQGNHRISAF